jgi:hypothetical protein
LDDAAPNKGRTMGLAPTLIAGAGDFAHVAARRAPLIEEFRSPSNLITPVRTIRHVPTSRPGVTARMVPDPNLPSYTRENHPSVAWTQAPRGRLFGASGLPRISDATQGYLGNCWFVSHMGSLALRTPHALRDMFEETAEHFIVHFADESIAVSKSLPMIDGVPVFAGNKSFAVDRAETGLWPAVLEKAAAAREPGGYESLKGGQARWAFRNSLGAQPTQLSYPGSTPYEDALRALQRGGVGAVGTMPGVTGEGDDLLRMSLGQRAVLDAANVKGNHYYTLLGAGQAKDAAASIKVWDPLTPYNDDGIRPTILDGTRTMTRDHFNAVVTDVDAPHAYGHYLRTSLHDELHTKLDLDRTPWFSKLDPESGLLS